MKGFCGLLVFFILFETGAQPIEGVTIREVFIPMPDGIRLAADLYVPENMPSAKLPVLLEYLPYRKDEGRRNRFGLFSYFVKSGYIVARVDIRGTGRSQGRLVPYEYSEEEQEDGEVVIGWLSKQSFCNGSVGMFGISWGGFNAIQMAMRRPPALKAIITIMSTDDIYQDDVHFIDGMMHVDAYEIGQDLSNILPGAPDFVIDKNYFSNRFETTPWFLQYKKQQRDGPFWDRASLNADYSRINIPVFAIGGWYDGYRDAVFRMMSNLKSPVKVLIGPWNHTFPNWAEPPPAIEWRSDAVRWFDHCLNGTDNGIMEEPRFSAFIRDWHAPGTDLDTIRGHWLHAPGWPVKESSIATLFFEHQKLVQSPLQTSLLLSQVYKPSAGPEMGGSVMWWGDWSPDQRAGDATYLHFETEPLEQDVNVLGFPKAHLAVSATASRANWFVTLNDVAPTGEVTLVTGAGFNGTHRESATEPKEIQPDKEFPLEIELHATSWIFRKDHRIRVAVGNSLWPMIWPTPYLFTSTLRIGGPSGSSIQLPLILDGEPAGRDFPLPNSDPELPGYASISKGTNSGFAEVATVKKDGRNGTVSVRMANEDGTRYPWGSVFGREEVTHTVNSKNPAMARVESRYTTRVELTNRTLVFEGKLEFRSDNKYFYYNYTRTISENGKLLHSKTWNERFPRDYQ